MHKPQFFFQDKDYFEAQKTWELKKIDNSGIKSKQTTTKLAEVASTEDMFSTYYKKKGSPPKNRGVYKVSEYEQNLQSTISKSIKVKSKHNEEYNTEKMHRETQQSNADKVSMVPQELTMATRSKSLFVGVSKSIKFNTADEKVPKR